jgi:hypothetical protein
MVNALLNRDLRGPALAKHFNNQFQLLLARKRSRPAALRREFDQGIV